MDTLAALLARFEHQRTQLWAIAYRMLGSFSEADDAVQETWIRLNMADMTSVENVEGWLTRVIARICLNVLRARALRREEPLSPYLPDPLVSPIDEYDPEQAVIIADEVGLALQIVLGMLGPSERLAFILHDVFALPFAEIAPIVQRSVTATRQLASRARHRVHRAAPIPGDDLTAQRAVVEAFRLAAHDGDFQALLAVLDPTIVLRADTGTPPVHEIRDPSAVAEQALAFATLAHAAHVVKVNGTVGLLVIPQDHVISVMGFSIHHARIIEIDILADVERLAHLNMRFR